MWSTLRLSSLCAGFFLIAVAASGCKRQCESSQNCIRQCRCTNTVTNNSRDCPIAYLCEPDQYCEAAYADMSCDELCKTYDDKSLCGVERCDDNDDCTKNLSCPLADGNGVPTGQTIDCRFTFQCDVTASKSCDGASTIADASQCVLANPAIQNALLTGQPCVVAR
jgi:hypothetical protein